MLDARLHSRRGNRPDFHLEIEFVPGCIERFARPGGGQDQELESSRGDALPLAKFVHEGGQLEIGKRRVMSARETVGSWQGRVEVSAPGGRVLARAESFGLRGVQAPARSVRAAGWPSPVSTSRWASGNRGHPSCRPRRSAASRSADSRSSGCCAIAGGAWRWKSRPRSDQPRRAHSRRI